MMAEADVIKRVRNICINTGPRAALKALRRHTMSPRFWAVSYVLITRVEYEATVSELDALQASLARSDLEVAWQGKEKEVVMSRLHKLRAAAAAAEQQRVDQQRSNAVACEAAAKVAKESAAAEAEEAALAASRKAADEVELKNKFRVAQADDDVGAMAAILADAVDRFGHTKFAGLRAELVSRRKKITEERLCTSEQAARSATAAQPYRSTRAAPPPPRTRQSPPTVHPGAAHSRTTITPRSSVVLPVLERIKPQPAAEVSYVPVCILHPTLARTVAAAEKKKKKKQKKTSAKATATAMGLDPHALNAPRGIFRSFPAAPSTECDDPVVWAVPYPRWGDAKEGNDDGGTVASAVVTLQKSPASPVSLVPTVPTVSPVSVDALPPPRIQPSLRLPLLLTLPQPPNDDATPGAAPADTGPAGRTVTDDLNEMYKALTKVFGRRLACARPHSEVRSCTTLAAPPPLTTAASPVTAVVTTAAARVWSEDGEWGSSARRLDFSAAQWH